MVTGKGFGVNRRTLLAASLASGAAAGVTSYGTQTADAATTIAAAAATTEPPKSAALAAKAVEESRDAILRISREVWANAELGLEEVKSAAIHIRELEAAGFKMVARSTASHPTAFLAEWTQGSGGSVIGYLPEYDALPGLGNAAEPRPVAGPTGTEVGHGCGHNMLGAGNTGGAIALKKMMEADGTAGTIRVYGCAAEETEGAKVYMVREGLFDDVDAVLSWHPTPIAATGLVRMNATNAARIVFRGRTAHAGTSPWEGRSALKAAELFSHGIQSMREHVLPSARLHFIYEAAGVAPNVVPDFAQIWIYIRDLKRSDVEAMTEWARQIAEGSAMATQTTAEFILYFGMYDLVPNEPLADLLYRHMQTVPLEWTAEEQDFARACQKGMDVPEKGMATQLLPYLRDISAGGSTDVGDISYKVPVGQFGWPTLPLGVSLHTWPVTACGGMSIGDKGSLNSAKILAGAGYDIMTDAAIREAAKADLKKRVGDVKFVSPLPPDRKQPFGLPKHLVKTGEDDFVAPLDDLA